MSGIMSTTFVIFFLSLFFDHVYSLGATDTITWGGDNSRTGYQTNHNMDPAIVGSSQFGQLFKTALPGKYGGAAEQVFSQPLVYTTPSDGIQYVYLATTQNNLYKINAKTGAIVLSRNLAIPFLTSDLNGCVDINPHVGVTATGVIDPDTDTLYLTSKTYSDQRQINVAQGKPSGRYFLHAINVNDLSERPNFPVNLEGVVARNNPIRSFNGGIHHQRPALLHTGRYIYAGFASHCVQYNFTGWIMGWDKTTGAQVERWATEGGGVPNTTPGAGVWMSGGGLASDDAGSLFFASGNGYASQLSTIPVNGRNPPTSLEEAAVHMTINDDGSLTIVDFFMPWEKTQLDGADRDLGTSPLELLPKEFSCGDIQRIGVVTGKSGKTYWLNLDDLGGYQNGPNKLDDIIQVYQNENSVYAGAGVYPLEGGYIYINVIQYPTHVFKFSCTNGVPSFTKVADSPTKNAYVLGVGHGTTTSLNGQPGTGLVWTSDVDGQNLRVYNAVPVNGLMVQIAGFNIPGTTKFTRPVFGDGRVYMGTTQGYFYGFGSPVNLPLNCTSPVDFGTSNLNAATTLKTITCKANIGVTVTNFNLTGNANFNITNVPTTPLNVAAGGTFSFQAYFNPGTVGPLSSDIVLTTTNNVAGYSTSIPITLRGTGQSVSALLQVSPVTLAFQGVITGAQVGGVNQSVLFNNLGNAPLTISDIKYSVVSETGPFVTANMTAAGPKAGAFTFIGLPTTIPGNTGVTVRVNFDTSTSGNFGTYLNVVSNGGTKVFDVVGTSGSAPSALLEFQTPDGTGWVQYKPGQNFTFGNVTENTTRSLKMRLTNNATSDSARLSLTVSKPPFGVSGIIGANNQVDLAEGTTLAPGENATATLYCSVPKTQWNTQPYSGTAQWTMNVDDPNFGKQFIQFSCNAVAEQAAPLLTNGLGKYQYTGCFKENNPGRQLKTQIYGDAANTIAKCIAACAAGNYDFCGTQYNRECWGGPTIPVQQVSELDCNYPCSGDINQICGGNGVGSDAVGSYISLFADSTRFSGNVTSTTPSGPFVNPGVDGYTSMGCYKEATTGRALTQEFDLATPTVKNCVDTCSGKGFTYAGLEYGGECWCGNTLAASSVSAAASSCSMPCNGNGTEYCGAGGYLNLYMKGAGSTSSSSSILSSSSQTSTGTTSLTSSLPSSLTPSLTLTGTSSSGTVTGTSSSSTPTATGPAIKQNVGSYAYKGCWTEATTGRALGSLTYANDAMTLESCAAFCSKYTMFGVEYGRECYCGNTLAAGSVAATNQADCSFKCPGDATEYCGAGNRLQLYTLASPLSSSSFTSISSISSVSSSLSSSQSTSPQLISSLSSSVPSSSISSSSVSSSVVISSLSSSVSSTSSSSSAGPTQTLALKPTVGAYTRMGCYTEGTNARALTGAAIYDYKGMTLESCAGNCTAFQYWGVEYGGECYCGNSLGTGSVLATKQTDCSFTCPGNKFEYCGAGNRLEMYKLTAAQSSISSVISSTSSVLSSQSSSQSQTSSQTQTSSGSITAQSSVTSTPLSSQQSSSSSSVPPTTSSSQSSTQSTSSSTLTLSSSSSASSQPATYTGPPVTSNGNTNFTYYSCVSEPSSGRLLSSQDENNGTSMTISKCLSDCSQYKYAGVEYGRECWCGNTLDFAGNSGATPGKNVTDKECNYVCPGNSSEFCGAASKLSLFYFDFRKVARDGGV
ncbi:WSC-domain-containing protein [Mollisia scopiformis]|uniref:WSC-domain-containing protein n=1 Tax=Mollisia scopiformis TaxID=149040 RepID=A0A194XH21_MOLSC|nr:WSC-domain-containing protein [Mollisia scopiformis]KUJ19463.1 WSC-domain-containing protein [Mollisia scopiformis]